MNSLPQRQSLVTQAANSLREAIRTGAWSRWLPGEHELGERFQISRGTLRAALAQLEREGWLSGGQGRRRQILKPVQAGNSTRITRNVALLSPLPLQFLPPFVILWIDELRNHLAEAGHQLEIHAARACYGPKPDRELGQLLQRQRTVGWILLLSTAGMQQWFSRQALPCLIAGSRHEEVKLSSVDLDHRAVCHHAVGLMTAKGYRRLVYLSPKSGVAGDWKSEQGFREAVQAAGARRVEAIVMQHDGSRDGVCARLDDLLQRSESPTGFLVARAPHALAALGHLLRRGIRIPKEAALVSRDDDPFFEFAVPKVARYATDPSQFARKLSRLVLQLADRGAIRTRDYRIMPRFLRGETLP